SKAVKVLLLPLVAAPVVVALGALELGAEEDSADCRGRFLRIGQELEILQVEDGPAAFLTAFLGEEQLPDPTIVRLVLGELVGQPATERAAELGHAIRRVPAEYDLVPDGRLMRRKARIGQQSIDQLGPLVWMLVAQELNCLLVAWNGADQVDEDAAQKG